MVHDLAAHAVPIAPLARSTDLSTGRRVLVVDDEALVRQLVSKIVGGLGLRCEQAASIDDVRERLSGGSFDLIVLDLSLGRTDAIEVLGVLRAAGFRGVVLLLSGHDALTLEHVRAGGRSYGLSMLPPIRKPFKPDVLRAAIVQAGLAESPSPAMAATPVIEREALLAPVPTPAPTPNPIRFRIKVSPRTLIPVGYEVLLSMPGPSGPTEEPDRVLAPLDADARRPWIEKLVTEASRSWTSLARNRILLRPSIDIASEDVLSDELVDVVRHHRPNHPAWPGLLLCVPAIEIDDDTKRLEFAILRLRLNDVAFAIKDVSDGQSRLGAFQGLRISEVKLHDDIVRGCADSPP